MGGWLVVNHFLTTQQFTSLYERFSEAAQELGIGLEIVTNVEAAMRIGHPADAPAAKLPGFVLFWDKDIRLCVQLEQLGIRCFNSAHAIETCDDKTLTHLTLQGNDAIALPRTIIVPKAFEAVDWDQTEFPAYVAGQLGLPAVVKRGCGSFGGQVVLARDEAELAAALHEAGDATALVQEFIAASAGTDVRLQMVGGTCVAAMRRTSTTGDFRSNVVQGATACAFEPPQTFIDMADACCQAIGLDFAGVDFLIGEDGSPIVCEVNSNAHFKTIERVTGADVPGAILRHVQRRLTES